MTFNPQKAMLIKVTYIHECFFIFNAGTIDDDWQGCLMNENDDDKWDNVVQSQEHQVIGVNEKCQYSLVFPWYLEPRV